MEYENIEEENENINNTSSSSKESEAEDLDAIKRFIEGQDDGKAKEKHNKNAMESLEDTNKVDESGPKDIPNLDNSDVNDLKNEGEVHKLEDKIEETENEAVKNESQEETFSIATGVIDMILNESETRLERKKEAAAPVKHTLIPSEKGSASVSLKVGSKVEAKDFCEDWYPAQIVEVDYDEMEVLVHYEDVSKKYDEWISVSSPRLRPIGTTPKKPPVTPAMDSDKTDNINNMRDETKTEEKAKLTFAVGERCLAIWRDNRRFLATVHKHLKNGNYEIMFDDGFQWTCKASRLYKMKQGSEIRDSLSVDTSMPGPSTSAPSPILYGAGPISASQTPPYHTHLFDPTRDYLGSKTERREMKRKLNIKEIFNIGQKRKKKSPNAKVSMSRNRDTVKRKSKLKPLSDVVKVEIKTEIPDAVASIIGTIEGNYTVKEEVQSEDESVEPTVTINEEKTVKVEDKNDVNKEENEIIESNEKQRNKDVDPVVKEETKLEKFEIQDNSKHEKFIDKMKEVITKLEDGLSKVGHVASPKPEIQTEVKEAAETELPKVETTSAKEENNDQNETKAIVPKVKKSKKLRLSQQKKVKRQVEKVKNELEEMKKQVEEMKKRMLMQTEELIKSPEMPESFLLPGEWCAKWMNGQPVGVVSEIECEVKVDSNAKPALPRRSVQVEDKRLPPGWTKHMVRRSFGNSAGKWDVVLVSPNNRRFHTKTEMRNYFENNPDEALKPYEHALLDFGVHLKLSRRMGWVKDSPNADNVVVPIPAGLLSSTSPLVKRRKLKLNKSGDKVVRKKRKLSFKSELPRAQTMKVENVDIYPQTPGTSENQLDTSALSVETGFDSSTLEDGYVYVGSLKVQIIENLLRCPAEGCYKNFRNNTLLQMHIKHYHRELRKMMGATPKVLDLAYARTTMPEEIETKKEDSKVIKVKVTRPPKRTEEPKQESKELKTELQVQLTPIKIEGEKVPRSQDSPKLRNALINKPVKRPKVLLPVRRPEQIEAVPEIKEEDFEVEQETEIIVEKVEIPSMEPLDFETAISTHTVTKPISEKKKKADKKKSFAVISKKAVSEDDEWYGMNSDIETVSSFPRSETPDSKTTETKIEPQPISSESNEDQKDSNMYMYTENGERIKIVHMKREEIINCHCGFREEDGLMVQCELCLCWQHALCHNIQKESEVPEKYTCSICLNPRRGRRSQRFVHDQDRLYEGLLPAARPSDALRRTHELSGNLVRIEHALHALRVKYYVATKKDHPKLYLWAKDWENGELNITQEKLHSDYSDLNIMVSNIGKENLPLKPEEMRDMTLDMRTPPSLEEAESDRYSQREGQVGSQSLLSGFLSSPGGASLDLPISTSELERLAKSVQAEESQQRVIVPQPEAAIENSACRERLLRHIQRCQALIDARLDSIDAQIAELESQDPSFEDDETADYFPRTKQTIQMLLRDLDTMEELGIVT